MKVKIIYYKFTMNLLSWEHDIRNEQIRKWAGTSQIKSFKSRPLYPRDSQSDKKFRAATVIKLLFP